MNENVNESDFDWVDSTPVPIEWIKPKLTLDNVRKDEDGWPTEYGNGEGEIWIDLENYSNDQRIEIIEGIERYLGSKLTLREGGINDDRGVKLLMCTSNRKKGLLLHCGHEDNHFFSQKNHVCCMGETYEDFMISERRENPMTVDRPRINGGTFLKMENLTEGFYYKGVNPTVDLIVIRGDKVLLIQRDGDLAEVEPGKMALPGGFHDTNPKEGEEWKDDKETSLEAAKREVKEETGLDVDKISGLVFQMVGVYEGGGRDPRDKEESWTRSTVYMVQIPETEGDSVKGMDDAPRAEWVPIEKVLQYKLAFDHHKIVEKALTMNESEAKEILKTLLTESSNFEWTEDLPKIPLPRVGDRFMWGVRKDQDPIIITKVDDSYVHSNDVLISFETYDSEPFSDSYGYKYWVEDYEDGVIKPILKEDLDWVSSVPFKVTDDYIKDLLSNCEDIPITNYNTNTKSPYIRRGKMNIMYYSMCPFWWDKLKDEPQDEHGRGKGEWFQSGHYTPDDSVAVVMPDRNGVTDIRSMDNDDFSAIAYDLKGISRNFNGEGGELWLFLDKNGNPRYDLVPDHLVDEVRQGFEGVEPQIGLEESFGWTDEIPDEIDFNLWDKVATDIDNEVSVGPYLTEYIFRKLTRVLAKYNIDIDDMGEFFMAPPDGVRDKDGNHITNYQLHNLHKDLMEIGVSLTPEQERDLNLESINESEFEWMESIKPSWLRLGQKFTNVHNLRSSRHPEGKIQIGGGTFEIYDINNKHGEPHLRFTHHDTMAGRNWERKKEEEINKNYGGTKFTQAKHNIDSGFWIPLTDCEFEASKHPNIIGKTKPDGSPYGHTYCIPDTSFEHMSNIKESSDFDWVEEHQPWEPGGLYVIDFTTEDEDVSGYLGMSERRRRQQVLNRLNKLGYRVNNSFLTHCFYYLEDYKVGKVDDEKWDLTFDDCVVADLDEIYELIDNEGYEILTPQQFFDMTKGSIET